MYFFLQKIRTYLRTYIALIYANYHLRKNLFRLTWEMQVPSRGFLLLVLPVFHAFIYGSHDSNMNPS